MNRLPKYIIETALAISIVLNLIAITTLSGYSTKFNNIEHRLNTLSNYIGSMNNKVSTTIQPDKPKIQNDIMTPSELATYLKIDIDKVYRLIIENPNSKFPCTKFNGEVRFSKNAIDEYMLKVNNKLE